MVAVSQGRIRHACPAPGCSGTDGSLAGLVTAAAHAVYFLALVEQVTAFQLVTGIVSLVLLAFLTMAGYWIEHAVRVHHVTKSARWLHVALGVVFLGAVLVHAGV